ncbi:hypothetical protein J969_4472, partial [Acinetobacter baumannii 26016_3]
MKALMDFLGIQFKILNIMSPMATLHIGIDAKT